MTDAERIAQLEAALAERDALLGIVQRTAWATVKEIVDGAVAVDYRGTQYAAWPSDQFERFERIIASSDAARRAADQWRKVREIVAQLAEMRPTRDYGTVPIPVALILRAKRALGQIEGEG